MAILPTGPRASQRKRGWQRHGPVIGGFALIALVGFGLYRFVAGNGGVQAPVAPEVQQISVVVPPPPPPPPPETPPPPEPEMQEVDVPEPEPEPVEDMAESEEPPPGEDLGLDAEGVAGSDGFGLRAKKGGRGLIGGGDAKAWYGGLIAKDLKAALAAIEDIPRRDYEVVVRIWVAADGRIEDSELVSGSGDAELDQALTAALDSGLRISRQPPEDLPQPIRLRISSRT